MPRMLSDGFYLKKRTMFKDMFIQRRTTQSLFGASQQNVEAVCYLLSKNFKKDVNYVLSNLQYLVSWGFQRLVFTAPSSSRNVEYNQLSISMEVKKIIFFTAIVQLISTKQETVPLVQIYFWQFCFVTGQTVRQNNRRGSFWSVNCLWKLLQHFKAYWAL